MIKLHDIEAATTTEHADVKAARAAFTASNGRVPGRWVKTTVPGTTRAVFEKADDRELFAVAFHAEDEAAIRNAFGF